MKLVERQLQRALGHRAELLSPEWQSFVESVDAAYRDAEDERALLEHVLSITSEELLTRNNQLKAELVRRLKIEADLRQLHLLAAHAASEWRATFDAVADPLLVMNEELQIERLNEAAAALANRPLLDLLDFRLPRLCPDQPWQTALDLARSGGGGALVHDQVTGRAWHVSIAWSPSEDGTRCIAFMRDATELMRLQETLRRRETLSALGALVGGVAHEIRNPLFAISATLDALELTFPPTAECQEMLGTVRGELERLNTLVRDLLEYGRPTSLDRRSQPMAPVFAASVAAARPLAERLNVGVRVGVEPLPEVAIDASRLVQVLGNLLENALHHAPSGSVVDLMARPDTRGSTEGVLIEILDRGPGIQPEDRARLFEPFFTRRKGGVGLGLCVVQRIVDDHQGIVEIVNRDGGGACAIVWLPIVGSEREER